MIQTTLMKVLVGSSVLVGGASSGAYFGTKTTVEQYLKHDKRRNTTKEDFEKIISTKTNSNEPNSEEFSDFKTNSTWAKLREICDSNLDTIQAIFGKEQKNISEEFKNDLKGYCFYAE